MRASENCLDHIFFPAQGHSTGMLFCYFSGRAEWLCFSFNSVWSHSPHGPPVAPSVWFEIALLKLMNFLFFICLLCKPAHRWHPIFFHMGFSLLLADEVLWEKSFDYILHSFSTLEFRRSWKADEDSLIIWPLILVNLLPCTAQAYYQVSFSEQS